MSELDDLDIYNDLDEFHEKQEQKYKELQAVEKNYQETLRTVEQLKLENKQLSKKIKTMQTNFQILLDTAKAEVRRKDQVITQLRKEKDDICFRRSKPYNPFASSNVQQVTANQTWKNYHSSYNSNNNKTLDKKERTVKKETATTQLEKSNAVLKTHTRHDSSSNRLRKHEQPADNCSGDVEPKHVEERNRTGNSHVSRGRHRPRSCGESDEVNLLKISKDEQYNKEGHQFNSQCHSLPHSRGKSDENISLKSSREERFNGEGHQFNSQGGRRPRSREKSIENYSFNGARDDQSNKKSQQLDSRGEVRTKYEHKDIREKPTEEKVGRVEKRKRSKDSKNCDLRSDRDPKRSKNENKFIERKHQSKENDVSKLSNEITKICTKHQKKNARKPTQKREDDNEKFNTHVKKIKKKSITLLEGQKITKVIDKNDKKESERNQGKSSDTISNKNLDVNRDKIITNELMRSNINARVQVDDYLYIFTDTDLSDEDTPANSPKQDSESIIKQLYDFIDSDENSDNTLFSKIENFKPIHKKPVDINVSEESTSAKITQNITDLHNCVQNEVSEVVKSPNSSNCFEKSEIIRDMFEEHNKSPDIFDENSHERKTEKGAETENVNSTENYHNGSNSQENKRDLMVDNQSATPKTRLDKLLKSDTRIELSKKKSTENSINTESNVTDNHNMTEPEVKARNLGKTILNTDAKEKEQIKTVSDISVINIEIEKMSEPYFETVSKKIKDIRNSNKTELENNHTTEVELEKKKSSMTEINMEIDNLSDAYFETVSKKVKDTRNFKQNEPEKNHITKVEQGIEKSNMPEINMEIDNLSERYFETVSEKGKDIRNSNKTELENNHTTEVELEKKKSNMTEINMEIDNLSDPYFADPSKKIEDTKNFEKTEHENKHSTKVEQGIKKSNITEINIEFESIPEPYIELPCLEPLKIIPASNEDILHFTNDRVLLANEVENSSFWNSEPAVINENALVDSMDGNEEKRCHANDSKKKIKWGSFKIPKTSTPPKLQWGSFKIPKNGSSNDILPYVSEKINRSPITKTNSTRVRKTSESVEITEINVVWKSDNESNEFINISKILEIQKTANDDVSVNETSLHNSSMAALVEEIFDKSAEQYTTISPSICTINSIEMDEKIDFEMKNIFQSPQSTNCFVANAIVEDAAHASNDDLSNLNSSIIPEPTENKISSKLHSSANNLEDVNVTANLNISAISSDTSFSEDNKSILNSSSEIKQLSMGSSSYVFEKVSENVINLHITRLRSRRKKKR